MSLVAATFICIKLHSRWGGLVWAGGTDFVIRLAAGTGLSVVGFVIGREVCSLLTAQGIVGKLSDFAIPSVFGAITFLIAFLWFRLSDSLVLQEPVQSHSEA